MDAAGCVAPAGALVLVRELGAGRRGDGVVVEEFGAGPRFHGRVDAGDLAVPRGAVAVGQGAFADGDGIALGEGVQAQVGQVVIRPAGTDLELVLSLQGEAHREFARQLRLALRRRTS